MIQFHDYSVKISRQGLLYEMLTTRRYCTFLLAFSLALSCFGTPTVKAQVGPDDFIRTVAKKAINSLANKQITASEKEEHFRKLLRQSFELKLIARFTLGRFWRRATKDQKTEYTKLFEDFVVKAYAARFSDYKGEKFIVGKVRKINDRDFLVQSEFILMDGRKIPVFWRLRNSKTLKIIDVLVEGVSMAITQRDEFAAIINRSGGKLDGLISALRKKTRK